MTDAAPNRLLIPVLSAANFVIGTGAFVVVGVLEPLGRDLGVGAAQAGSLMTVYAMAYAVLSPLLVSLTGGVGRRRVLAIALALFALATALSALAGSFWLLTLSRVLAAAGAGMFTPVAAAVAATLYPPEQRARVLAAVFFGLTLAQVAGVPGGSFIAYTFGWRWAFATVLLVALPCTVLIWRHVPAGLRFQPVTLGDLARIMGQGRLMLATLFTGAFLGAIYVLYTYAAPLLSQTMGFGRDGISLALAVFGAGAVAGNILGGVMADALGWRRTLIALTAAQVVIMPVFSLLPLPAGWVFVLFFVWAVSGWSFMAGQQLRLIGLAGPMAPVVLALNAAAIYLGAAGGSAIGAILLQTWGVGALGLGGGLAAALALLHLLASIRWAPAAPRTA